MMMIELVLDFCPLSIVLAVALSVKLLIDSVALLKIVENVVERSDVSLKMSVPFAVIEPMFANFTSLLLIMSCLLSYTFK